MHTAQDPNPDPALPTVEVVLFDGFAELDAVGPWDVLAGAGFRIRAVGFPDGVREVRGANGLAVAVDGPIGERPGLVIVPGGGWLFSTDSGVRAVLAGGVLPGVIARLHTAGTIVASVCTGALVLAGAGLLHSRPAVTNRQALDDLRATGADVRGDFRVVDDGDVMTCAGPLAGVDLAIRIVERFAGVEAAQAIAEHLDHERRGPLLVTNER